MTEAEKFSGFKLEELAAQKAAVVGRSIAMVAIAIFLTGLSPWPMPVYYYFTLSTFVVLGWAAYWLAQSQRGRPWHQYAFVTADFAFLAFVILYPNPFAPDDFPPQLVLRGGAFVHFFVLLAGLTYIYQARLVLWGGISAAFAWMVGVVVLLNQPETIWLSLRNNDLAEFLKESASPHFVSFDARIQEAVVFLIVAGLLALAVKRARTIALRQINLAREKTNLARYFPPKTAELLAHKTKLLSEPREHKAAILFADLVGFTTWSQRHTPTETIELLRKVQGLLTEIVFHHNGTLDKFMGDGLMATFGTPEPTDLDASNALAAAICISKSYEELRLSKAVGEGRRLKLAVGVHYGPIIIGDVGTKDRLEFAVLGDTVNVASRLEQAARKVGCMCLLSDNLIRAAESEGGPEFKKYRDLLSRVPPIELRGRSGKFGAFSIKIENQS
ncbi:MAG: adenylate/guanylate cyclase domain-containing protein [Hyphomicrobiales bacterium]